MSEILTKAIFAAGCIMLPVVWGYVVNRLFNLWRERTGDDGNEDPFMPDYQI